MKIIFREDLLSIPEWGRYKVRIEGKTKEEYKKLKQAMADLGYAKGPKLKFDTAQQLLECFEKLREKEFDVEWKIGIKPPKKYINSKPVDSEISENREE